MNNEVQGKSRSHQRLVQCCTVEKVGFEENLDEVAYENSAVIENHNGKKHMQMRNKYWKMPTYKKRQILWRYKSGSGQLICYVIPIHSIIHHYDSRSNIIP